MADRGPGEIVGVSECAERLRSFVQETARDAHPVTLVGEPGTGKELAARLIHEGSSRRKGPFLMIDCSLYYERELKRELFGSQNGPDDARGKKGLLEFAGKGTCYLSRIEELTPGLQAGLLRFLASGRFRRLGDGKEISSNVRIVVSSDRNLKSLVDAGLFDAPLYERLSEHAFRLSPLRERAVDIPVLVDWAIRKAAARHGRSRPLAVHPDALEALQAYPWPRNFDEILAELERLLRARRTEVGVEQLSPEISGYWLGRKCDPRLRRALEELDACIAEFKVFSKLEADLGEDAAAIADWLDSEEAAESGPADGW